MPTYCFKNEVTGEVVEKGFPMADVPESIRAVGGKIFVRSRSDEWSGRDPNSRIDKAWTRGKPLCSNSMSRHPFQAKEYYEVTKRHGCPTHLNEKGQPKIYSKRQRNGLLKLFHCVDRDGGYGDHTG